MTVQTDEFRYPENTTEILAEYVKLKKQGKHEEASAVIRQLPVPPHLSAASMLVYGKDWYEEMGYTVSKRDALEQLQRQNIVDK